MRLLLAACLALLPWLAQAQALHKQFSATIVGEGSVVMSIATHPLDGTWNLWMLVHVTDTSGTVRSITIKQGNKLLATCADPVSPGICIYVWPRDTMPATPEYSVTSTNANGSTWTYYGKLRRPVILLPP